jgi:hypothetical protein
MEVSDHLRTSGEEPSNPLNRSLGWPQSQFGRFGEQAILLHCQETNHYCLVFQPLALSVYHPCCPGSKEAVLCLTKRLDYPKASVGMVAKRIFLVLTVNGTSFSHFRDGKSVLKKNLVSGISCYCSCLMSLNKSYFHNRNFVWLLFSSCSCHVIAE